MKQRVLLLRCPSCNRVHSWISLWQPWCQFCVAEVRKWHTNHCQRCGSCISEGHLCGICQTQPPLQDRAIHALSFETPVRDMIHAFKFRFWFFLVRPFSLSLAGAFQHLLPEFSGATLIPVPSHPLRVLRRRFDSTAYLTKALSNLTGNPVRNLIRKTSNRKPQSRMSASLRKQLPDNIFLYGGKVTPDRVVVVDDVYTTGATTRAAVNTLHKAGVRRLSILTLSRTPS